MCAEISGNNIPQNTNTAIKSPEKTLDESIEEDGNISTNDSSDDGALIALIMNGPELDLLKDLETI